MLDAIVEAAGETPVVAPLRGRARELVVRHGGFQVVSPLSYLQFGWLTSHAQGIITDSGNVAEEATFNNVPCITLNSYTEHIETVKQGSNELVGEDADKLRQRLTELLEGRWKKSSLPDRWDGRTAERIVKILTE
jgi:UDP-N-acetylglucosamine 2-epimerase (non-hydrolysing)